MFKFKYQEFMYSTLQIYFEWALIFLIIALMIVHLRRYMRKIESAPGPKFAKGWFFRKIILIGFVCTIIILVLFFVFFIKDYLAAQI